MPAITGSINSTRPAIILVAVRAKNTGNVPSPKIGTYTREANDVAGLSCPSGTAKAYTSTKVAIPILGHITYLCGSRLNSKPTVAGMLSTLVSSTRYLSSGKWASNRPRAYSYGSTKKPRALVLPTYKWYLEHFQGDQGPVIHSSSQPHIHSGNRSPADPYNAISLPREWAYNPHTRVPKRQTPPFRPTSQTSTGILRRPCSRVHHLQWTYSTTPC